MKYEIEVRGVPVSGYEENYLSVPGGDSLGMCGLLRRGGAESIDDSAHSAFGYLHDHDPGQREFWGPYIAEYRRESGRDFPPLYRIRFAVEVEKLPDAESDAFWESYARARATSPGAPASPAPSEETEQ